MVLEAPAIKDEYAMIIRRVEAKRVITKVAAYIRVSTLTEEQEESYETQVDYYTRLIQGTEGWGLAGIYADQGITGTSARKRPAFMRMIRDARQGKMDTILCKSISRFARNARDAQVYVQYLKNMNVEVRFEKEGINTFDPSSDFIFSLNAAWAQEESRSISENVKWTNKRLAEQGIRHLGNNRILGYDEKDGILTPNKDAWIIKLIFEEYSKGIAITRIIQNLQEKGAHRMRSDKAFSISSILVILKNEVYLGDRIIQKSAPLNYLTKKPDPNVAYDSYFISNDHEGIITRSIWDATQERIKKQQLAKERGLWIGTHTHFLYGMIFCGECGEPYRRFTAKDRNGTYKIWRCRKRAKTGECGCRHIRENDLLQEISQKLGWDCKCAEAFDNVTFLEIVERVIVGESWIKVVLLKNDEY